ncbi:winged helix-turn-helix transcriptional regulator [Candidatus Falkowbacteria bacterium]|nr:winged helix-turn-helix transcriptional regulator [Candidatus Falkowbacteria bacterium]
MPKNTKQLSSLLFLAQRILHRHVSGRCASSMSILHLETVRYIKDNEAVTMRSLSKYLGITPPSATSLVNDLAEQGLIKRKGNEGDRRVVELEVTAKGKKRLKEGLSNMVLHMDKTLSKLTPEEQEQLVKMLLKITE